MGFIKQIRFEIRNILKSKFLFIMAILAIVFSVAIPAITYISQKASQNPDDGVIRPTATVYRASFVETKPIDPGYFYPGPIDKGEPIIIDGVTIELNNPFYWNLQSILSEKAMMESGQSPFKNPASIDLWLKLSEEEIKYFLMFAKQITTHQDYRQELAWRGTESLYDKFFLEHNDVPLAVLEEVAGYRKGVDPAMIRQKYIDITSEQKLAGIVRAEEELALIQDIVSNNNFPKYIDMRVKMSRNDIEELKENIAVQEKAILDNPTLEDQLNQVILDLKRQITMIETITIPIFEYRLEKMIIPGLPIWQNNALSDIENSRNQLNYTVIQTEEDWNNSRRNGGWNENTTYREYVAQMQRQIDNLNKTIIIAQKSLDSDRPDMAYVPQGSRSKTTNFLQYTSVIALFGVLLGGWLIASEYQQGTIRLLMIRPKTRTKILLSKLLAAIFVWLVITFVSSLLNGLSNGILFGFADFAFPNYTVAGQMGFIAFYIPKLLACLTPILFMFTGAFMLSVVVKNIAVAIALPILFYIGSVISTVILGFSANMGWLAYTPIPFMQMPSFFSRNNNIEYIIQRGVNLNLTYGILLLIGLSVVFTAISVVVFKKRDIVN